MSEEGNRGSMTDKKLRWYDSSDLGLYIRKMEFLSKEELSELLIKLKFIITKKDPDILLDHVMKFQLYRNRWYDKDPYSWLVINALQYIDNDLLIEVINFLKIQLDHAETNIMFFKRNLA